MTKNLVALAAVAAVATLGAGRVAAQDAVDTSNIFVKKAIADTMTPEQLEAYKVRLAQRRASGVFDRARPPAGRTPAERTTTYAIRRVFADRSDDPLEPLDEAAAHPERFGSYFELIQMEQFRFRDTYTHRAAETPAPVTG